MEASVVLHNDSSILLYIMCMYIHVRMMQHCSWEAKMIPKPPLTIPVPLSHLPVHPPTQHCALSTDRIWLLPTCDYNMQCTHT